MGLVELITERIDLDHRVGRHMGGLYAGDVAVTDARHLTAKVRPVAGTDARRRSAGDPPSHETRLDYEQPLVQRDDALAIHAFDTEADMFVLVDSKLKGPSDSS